MNLQDIQNQIDTSQGVALYFTAPHCGVCFALKPKLEELFDHHFGKIRFISVPVEKHPEIAAFHNVFTAPALLVFLEGKEYVRKSTNMGIGEVKEAVGRLYRLLSGDSNE